MTSHRQEAWRYADLGALAAARALPATHDAGERRSLRDGERVERRLDAQGLGLYAKAGFGLDAGEATLIHRITGLGFVDAEIEIEVGNARLHHVLIADQDLRAASVIRLKVDVGAKGEYRLTQFSLGADYGRVEVAVNLGGAGADCTLTIVELGRADQNLETVSRIVHQVPSSRSRQMVRAVLRDQATASYLGTVRVERGADGTDSLQNARALLLNPGASANLKPELEIFADDVKCGHGAAVGALDADAVFYLMARGIPAETARAMLVEAFIADVVAGLDDPALQDELLGHAYRFMETEPCA